jgi:hypothetical protein
MKIRNLVSTGRINDNFIDTAKALKEVLAAGIRIEVFADTDEGFDGLDPQPYDPATVFLLRWRMLNRDKYTPFQDEWTSFSASGHSRFLKQTALWCGGEKS